MTTVQEKWVARAMWALVVTLLGTFAWLDRQHVGELANGAASRSHINERRIEVLESRTDVRLKNIEEDIREIKLMLREAS